MALGQDGNSKNSPSFKPYDASNSFVKKLASRVTGLIGWRSNSYENVGDASLEDLPNTSLTDDEAISPNPKRIKLHNTESPSYAATKQTPNEGCNIVQSVNDINVAGPSFKSKCMVASTPAVNYCGKNSPPNTGNVTDYLDSSTSSNISLTLPSCSTQQRHNITIPGVHHREMSTITTFDMNKSLNETSTMMNKRKPSFNSEVFSASSKRLSLSVCESHNRSCLSPFYSARTMYGGASALLPYSSQSGARSRSETSSKLNVFSPRNQITIQPVPSPNYGANDQETMSTAARRILDTLERYCSPIKDAKRIPTNDTSSRNEDDRVFTPRGVKRKLPSLTQIMPSTSDLLRIKRQEKMQDSILNARQVVSSVPESATVIAPDSDSSSDSADLDYTVFNEDTSVSNKPADSGQTKLKEENKYDDRPKAVAVSKMPQQPIAPVLKIANLPKFNITSTFTFSKPITLENLDSADESTSAAASTQTKPMGVPMGSKSGTTKPKENTLGLSKTTPTETKLKSFIGSPSRNEGAKSNPLLSSTIVMNNAANKPGVFSSPSNKSTSPTVAAKLSRWTCRKCLLENNGDKCYSCASLRSQQNEPIKTQSATWLNKDDKNSAQTSTSPASDRTATFDGVSNKNFSAFKIPTNNVTSGASSGVLSNDASVTKPSKSDVEKSADVSKPKDNKIKEASSDSTAATPAAVKTTENTSELWKNLQKQSDQWKCDDCWVQNKKTDAKCVACGAPNKAAPAGAAEEKAAAKPSFSFGMPADSTDSAAKSTTGFKFGAATASEGTKPIAGMTFGFGAAAKPAATTPGTGFTFGNTSAVSSSVVNTEPNSTPMFTFGIKKTEGTNIGSPVTETNKTTNDKVPMTQQKPETGLFNDVSSSTTNNKKVPFMKFGTSEETSAVPPAKMSFATAVASGGKNPLIRENGEDPVAASVFNDISSSTESPAKKKAAAGGFPVPSNMFSKDAAATTPSTPAANAFGSSNGLLNNDFKLPSSSPLSAANTSGGSLVVTSTTATAPSNSLFASSSFSSIGNMACNSKPNDVMGSFGGVANAATTTTPSIGTGIATTTPANATIGNPFGAATTNLFGNAIKNDVPANTDKSATSHTLFPMTNNAFGGNTAGVNASPQPAGNSIFGAFNNANSTAASTGIMGDVAKNTDSTAGPAPAINFNASASPFRFGGMNATPAPAAVPQQNSQPVSGGFAFNGPKLENSTPKFGFGASANATGFGAGNGSGFSFGGSATSAGSMMPASGGAPVENSIGNSMFASAAKAPGHEMKTNAFGATNVFGDATKKSGGFSFGAANQMQTPTMNSFSAFGAAVNDNQDQNRLNNSTTPSVTPFLFGGSANAPAAPAHNFNLSVPPTFNFSGSNANSMPSFTATPAQNAPVRKIKKAVRRTNK